MAQPHAPVETPPNLTLVSQLWPRPDFLSEVDHRMLDAVTPRQDGEWYSYPDGERQAHQIQDVHLPNREHVRLHTIARNAAAAGQATVVNLLGWTERVSSRLTMETHAFMADQLPDVDVSTEATYGMDGSTRAKGRRGFISLDEMAEEISDTLWFEYGEQPLILAPVSMDASVVARIGLLNESRKQKLNVVGRVMYEGCITSPENSGLPMAIEFGRHMRRDGNRIAHRVPLWQRPALLARTINGLPLPQDWWPVAQHGVSLLRHATPHDAQQHLAATNPIDIRGSEDCLTARRLPGLEGYVVREIEGAGHAMGAIAVERAAAIADGVMTLLYGSELKATS